MVNLYDLIYKITLNQEIVLHDSVNNNTSIFKIFDINVISDFMNLSVSGKAIDEDILIKYLNNVSLVCESVQIVKSELTVEPKSFTKSEPVIEDSSVPKTREYALVGGEIGERNKRADIEVYRSKLEEDKRILGRQRAYMIVNRHILKRRFGIGDKELEQVFMIWEDKEQLEVLTNSLICGHVLRRKGDISTISVWFKAYMAKCLELMKNSLKDVNNRDTTVMNAYTVYTTFKNIFVVIDDTSCEYNTCMSSNIKYMYMPQKLHFLLNDGITLGLTTPTTFHRWSSSIKLLGECFETKSVFSNYLMSFKKEFMNVLYKNLLSLTTELQNLSCSEANEFRKVCEYTLEIIKGRLTTTPRGWL